MPKALTIIAVFAASLAQRPSPDMSFIQLADGGGLMPSIERQLLPAPAATNTVSGDVDVEVVVGLSGTAAHTRIARSPDPSQMLDRACLDALQSWKFRPARSGNSDRSTLVRIRFEFTAGGQSRPSRVTALMTTVELTPGPRNYVSPPGAPAPVTTPGAGTQYPQVVRNINPRYTSAAMRAKIMGTVMMEVIVAADGTVGSAQIRKSLDAEHGLDAAALTAVRYWLFTPGTLNGAPVPMRVMIEMQFNLH